MKPESTFHTIYSRCRLLAILLTVCLTALSAADGCAHIRASVSKDYDKWNSLPAVVLKDKANAYLENQNPDSAMLCYSIIANRLPVATTREERNEVASAKINVGYMYSTYYYDFHKAFDNFTEALRIAEQDSDKSILVPCYVNLGALYSTYHQMLQDESMAGEAVKMYKKAYHTAKQSGLQTSLLTSVYNLAVVCLSDGNIDNIRNELNDFLRLDGRGRSERWRYVRCFAEGILAIADGNDSLAITSLRRSLSHHDSNSVPHRSLVVTDQALAINDLKHGRIEEAERRCLDVIEQSRKYDFRDITSLSYSVLSEIYRRLGNEAKMQEYRLRYFDFQDSLNNVSKIKDVKNLRFLQELNAKNEEMARLSVQEKRQSTFLTVSLLLLTVAILTILIFVVYSKRLHRRNLELYDRLKLTMMESEAQDSPEDGLSDSGAGDELPKDEPSEARYSGSGLSSEIQDDIMARAKAYMAKSDEIYSPDFTLDRLAQILEVNRSYLSQAVNETCGSNFKTLLNSYRIMEACRRFEDDGSYGGYTVEAIGQSVGFMSRKNFGIAFKKETGLSPSTFIKILKEKRKESADTR